MASFDENGKYIKTNWKAGDKITSTKLNKIEESIEAVNNNDISRHVEADARLDALEAKDAAHDKEFTNVKNLIADNKAATELGNYEINSRMTFLENELNEGIEEVHNVAETVDGKIATAEANMTSAVNQGKADMEAMVAEVEGELDSINAQLHDIDTHLEGDYVNVKSFGAVGDGITDDYESIWNAIVYCDANKKTLYFPNGVYLLGSAIDFTNLPYNYDGHDNMFVFSMKGESRNNTILMAKAGVSNILYYNPEDKTRYKTFIINNLSFKSQDPFDDYTVRAKCSAIKLLCSPHCEISNITMIGLEEGIHLKYCWFGKLEGIRMSRMSRGIYMDGTDEGGVWGQADHLFLKNIVVGGWTLEYALKISSSKSTKIINFDSEAGSSGLGILLEGCHSVEVDRGYIENYINGNPIVVQGLKPLDSLGKFSTNITIKGFRFYNCSTRPILLRLGVHNLTVKDCYFEFNSTAENPITNNSSQFIGLVADENGYRGAYYRNISILDNVFVADADHEFVFMEQYGIYFKHNGVTYLRSSNYGYYSPTYEQGTTLVELQNTPITKKFVRYSGSYGTLSGVTGTTTSGSNIIVVNDTSQIIPGTFVTIGELTRVKVLSKTDSRIVVGKCATSNQSNVSIQYEPPVLVDMN